MMSESQQNPTVQKERGHTLAVRDRGQITVSGVSEVLSFDEANVRLVTTCGILNLEGDGLRIHVLNTADGTVAAVLDIDSPLFARFDREDASGLQSLVEILEKTCF